MKLQWIFSFLSVLAILCFLTIKNYQNRVYDWDLPGYLGCLFSAEFPDSPEKVHEMTYSSIKKEASPLQYKDISGYLYPNKAVQVFAKNSTSFNEQLPYYRVKVGYNVLILFIYQLGFSAPVSVLLVSVISYFLSGLLLFFILKTLFPENYLLTSLLTVGVLLLPPLQFMSRIPCPDMLGFLLLLIFLLGLFKKWDQWMMFLILLITILIRPDYIIFALSYFFTLVIYAFITNSRKVDFKAFLQAIILLSLYIFIINYYHYPGWNALFYDSFIERRAFISRQPAHFTAHDYFEILFNKLINFKKVTISAVAIVALIFYFSKDFWVRVISVFIFANIYLKFLFFPDSATIRFFLGFVILLFVLLLYTLSKKYNGLNSTKFRNFTL